MTRQRNDLSFLDCANTELVRLLNGSKLFHELLLKAQDSLSHYRASVETHFSEWLRANPELDSKIHGLSIHNVDWVIHQFKAVEDKNGPRKVNNMMLIEEKRFSQELSFAQKDTLSVLDQCLRKGHKTKVVTEKGERVILRYFGLHKLRFSANGPKDSETILWDNKVIGIATLEELIRFERHPDSLKKRDVTERRHHANKMAASPLYDSLDQ